MHLHEQGQGTPTVVLESGIGASSLSWALVQPEIAKLTRVISYDRAGLGWSESSSVPRTVPGMVNELRSLLAEANIPPPYILVGHSFGGLLVRAYAALYAPEVLGLVLVDPVSVSYWANCPANELQRLRLGVKLSKRGIWAARLGLVRLALATLIAGRSWFPKLAARVGGRKGTAALANLVGEVRKLPAGVWPIVRSHWSEAKCFRALANYLDCLPESAKDAQSLAPNKAPTIILSAANAKAQELEERDLWVSASSRGRHIQVPDSGHWLHLENPQAVVRAVEEILRAGSR